MRKAILICTCSFSCPSMKDIDFAELGERIRLELDHDYMLMHPRLCEEDGEQLMQDLLKEDVVYITPACKEEKQAKLLRDGFAKAGVSMDGHWRPVSISFKTTDQAFDEIEQALREVES